MKRPIIIIIITLLHSISYGQAKKLFRQATNATDLNDKIELYTKVIELEPKNLDAYFYRGLAKNDLGDYSGAIVDYSKIIVLEPGADTYYNRGNSRYSLKDLMGAKDDYQNAFKLNASFVAALYSLACVKNDLEDFDGAIKDFTTLINAIPNEPKFYFHRALSYIALEKYVLALNDYSLAVLVDPSEDSYFNRGVFYLNINYYQKANDDFFQSIKLNDHNSFAFFYSGTTNLLLGKYDAAIADFNSALKFDTLDFDSMLGIALCYFKTNDFDNSKLYFEKVKSILSIDNNSHEIENYKNTYWFQNQYFFFNENFTAISKL